MNKDIIKGHWKEAQGKIIQQWGKLTNDELTQMQGTQEELIGALQTKYGWDKEETKRQVQNFINRQGWV